jgi:hypothetical protein
MYKCRLIEDRYVGVRNEAITRESADASSVLDAVTRLNGRDRSLVSLEGFDDNSLTIGGGTEGRYTVTFAVNIDQEFFGAIDERQAGDLEIDMVIGGQGTTLPLKDCVDLAAALEAARFFVENGKMAPNLQWEKK